MRTRLNVITQINWNRWNELYVQLQQYNRIIRKYQYVHSSILKYLCYIINASVPPATTANTTDPAHVPSPPTNMPAAANNTDVHQPPAPTPPRTDARPRPSEPPLNQGMAHAD